MVTQMMRRTESSLHACREFYSNLGLGMQLPGETGRTAVIFTVFTDQSICASMPIQCPLFIKKIWKYWCLKLWKPRRSSVYLSVWSKCQPCLLRWQICHETERRYINRIAQEVRHLCCFGPVKRQKSVTSKFNLNNPFTASGNAIGASE